MTLPAMTFSSATSAARRRADHDPPAGEALADVVVGVAQQAQRDAGGQERAERLAGGAGQGELDGAVGQAVGCALVTSWPSIVPTVRLTLRTAISARTARRLDRRQRGRSARCRSALSSSWSWPSTGAACRRWGRRRRARIGVRSRPAAFQCSIALSSVEARRGRSPPRWSGTRAPRGSRGPPRRCTRRRSRRTRACR